MSPLEQKTWATLAIAGAIFLWFQNAMLDGWRVADLPADEVARIYLFVVMATALTYGLIAAAVALRAGSAVARDERDAQIEAKANRNELFAITALINIAVFQAIAHAAVDGYAPMFDLAHLPSLVFALLGGLWVAEFVRLVSILAYSRL